MIEETLEQRISYLEQQFEQLAEAFNANSQLMVMMARELKRIKDLMIDEDPMGLQ
jgi:ABC-type branched-subunit amino acid transport system ATPase component